MGGGGHARQQNDGRVRAPGSHDGDDGGWRWFVPNGLAFMWARECDLFQSRSFHLESRRLVRSLRPQLIPLGLPIWGKSDKRGMGERKS